MSEIKYLQIGGATMDAFGKSEALRVRVGTDDTWEWRKLTTAEYKAMLDALNHQQKSKPFDPAPSRDDVSE